MIRAASTPKDNMRASLLLLSLLVLSCSGTDNGGQSPLADASDDASGDASGDSGADTNDDAADPGDAAVDPGDDVAIIDVSEAFCTCDDDCLPLGDGSLCNGTVCTFGVSGVPCADAGGDAGEDAPSDAPVDSADAPDDVSDVSTDTADDASDAATDTPVDAADAASDTATDTATDTVADADDKEGINSLVLEISGGFSGRGERDITIRANEMSVDPPFGTFCTAPLTVEQFARLDAAALDVAWASVTDSYRPVDNPTCCCDQFLYDLSITLRETTGSTSTFATNWCDQSLSEGLLPADLLAFLEVLDAVGDEVEASCAP